MKQTNKYKHLNTFKGTLKVSNRVLNFKRSKWNTVKKILFKTDVQPKVLDIYKQQVLPGWDKVKRSFKNRINFGRHLLNLNNNKRRKKSELLKTKFITRKDKINTILFKRFFELDFFLYSVYLTHSVNESRKAVEANKIYKNGINTNIKKNLKSGDLITFQDNNFNFNKIQGKFNSSDGINSFYECDYYTQSFVLLKSFNEVTEKDIYLSPINLF